MTDSIKVKMIPLKPPRGKNGVGTARYIELIVGISQNGAGKEEQRARWRLGDLLDRAVEAKKAYLTLENADYENLKKYINAAQLNIIFTDLIPIQDEIEGAKDAPAVVVHESESKEDEKSDAA